MAAAKTVSRAAQRSPITPSFTSADRVMVAPEDGDQFILIAAKAVATCQRVDYWESEARRQVNQNPGIVRHFDTQILRPLRAWCESHSSQVTGCYVPVPTEWVEIFVIGRSVKYDFDLGSEVSRLELQLVDAGWRVHVMMIPGTDDAGELRAHFDPDGAIEVYAEPKSAPSQGREEPPVPVRDLDL